MHAWPWIAVAAAGALHGLNPAAGWAAVAWSGRAAPRLPVARTLLPIAAGQVGAILVVAAGVPMALRLRLQFDPQLLQWIAAGLLLAIVARQLLAPGHTPPRVPAGQAGLALWSFIVAMAHGAGWMLVPALVPLCASGLPGREITASGSIVLALAAVGVHTAAMLLTTVAVAAGVLRGGRLWFAWVDRREAALPRGNPRLHQFTSR